MARKITHLLVGVASGAFCLTSPAMAQTADGNAQGAAASQTPLQPTRSSTWGMASGARK